MVNKRRLHWAAALATVALMSTACGGGSGDSASDSVLKLGVGTVPRGLDPAKGQSISETAYANLIFDGLTYVDENREIKPMIATSWEFSDDGSQLTLKLRDDVKFNDGTPLKADAVKASLERAKTLKDSTVAGLLDSIKSIEVVDDHEVVLNVTDGAGGLPAIFATPAGAVINPEVIDSGADLALNPPAAAGSGPWVLDRLTPNEKATFKKADDDYWDPEAGKIDRVEITTVQDENARTAGFQSGQYDMIFVRQDADKAEQIANSGEGKLYSATALTQFALFMRDDRGNALENPDVRRAINMVVDRNGISNDLLDGRCEPMTQIWPKGDPAHVDELDDYYPYDPQQAKDLIAKANVGPISISLITRPIWPEPEIVQVLQKDLTDIGITVKLETLEAAVAAPTYSAGEADTYLAALSGNASPIVYVKNSLMGAPGNLIGKPPAEAAALLEKAQDQKLSVDEQNQARRDFSSIITKDAYYAPICNGLSLHLAKNNVQGVDTMSWQWGFLFDPRYLSLK